MKEILHEHYRVGTQYSYSKGEKSLSNIFDVNDFEALTSLQVSGSSVLHFLHLEEDIQGDHLQLPFIYLFDGH